jgi:hypothetical protein
MKNIVDDVYRVMREERREFSSREIVSRFFMISDVSDTVAEKILRPLLGRDARFRRGEDHWRALESADIEDLSLTSAPFVLFAMEDVSRYPAVTGDPFRVIEERSSFLLYRGGVGEPVHVLRDVLEGANGFIFVPADRRSLSLLRKVYRMMSPLPLELLTLSVKNLMHALYPDRPSETWEDLLTGLEVIRYESGNPQSKVRTLVQVFERILDAAGERSLLTVGELIDVSTGVSGSVDWSRFGFSAGDIAALPRAPGVYRFTDREGDLLYVGKTGNLRARLRSYFQERAADERIRRLRDSVYGLDFVALGSDLESVIEEQKSITRDKPRLNTRRTIPERRIATTARIIVLPSSHEGILKLYLLSDSSPLLECDYDGRNGGALVEMISQLAGGGEYASDPLKTLALSYLKRYGDRLNVIELERYGHIEQVISILERFRGDFASLMAEKTAYIA